MVRSELLQKLCNYYPNILRRDIEKILEIIFFEISEALCRGENIEIRGFGSFYPKKYKSYKGRNPKTGESIQIPEKILPLYRPSRDLLEKLNSKQD